MAGKKGTTNDLMETTQVNHKQIDDNRAWFFAKDRSISLAQNNLYYLFTNQANGAYMSMAFISETVLSASATSITFSNIPQNFRHLMIFARIRSDAAAEVDNTIMRFNGDAGSNYDYQHLTVNNATLTGVVSRAGSLLISAGEAANSRAFNFSPAIIFIPGYSINTAEKFAIGFSGAFGNLSADADLFQFWRTGHWRNRNVITSITLLPNVGTNLVSGVSVQLYGVL